MPLYLPFLLLTLALLAGLYLAGYVLLRVAQVSQQEPLFAIFLACVLGLLVVVSAYAIATTSGRTVLLPLLPLVGFVVWQLRKRGPLIAPSAQAPCVLGWRRVMLELAGTAGILFTARFGLVFDTASSFLRTPFQDYVYYARVSALPLAHGIEGRALEYYYPQLVTATPYHYVELWLTNLLVRFSGLPALWCLYLSVYTVLITMVFAGLRALLAQAGLRGAWGVAIAGALLLTGGVYWPGFDKVEFIANGHYLATGLLLLEPKLAMVYILLLLGAILLGRRQYAATATVLAGLPLVFVSVVPGVGVGLVCLILYLRIKQYISWLNCFALLLPMLLAVGYMALFYYTVPAAANQTLSLGLPQVAAPRTIVHIFVGIGAIVPVYFAPFIATVLCLLWFNRRATRLIWLQAGPVLTFAFGCLAGGAVARSMFPLFLDSYQFVSNIVVPLLPVGLAVVLGYLLANATPAMRATTLVVLGLLAGLNFYKLLLNKHPMHETTRYSAAFLRQVQDYLAQGHTRGAFLLDDQDYQSAFTLSADSYTAGNYMSNFQSSYGLASLSALDELPVLKTDPRFAANAAQAQQLIAQTSLARFARAEAALGHYNGLDSLKYHFVRRHKIAFICASARAKLPYVLRPLVQAEYHDRLSGEALYIMQSAKPMMPASLLPK
jgi:hypothetical protein